MNLLSSGAPRDAYVFRADARGVEAPVRRFPQTARGDRRARAAGSSALVQRDNADRENRALLLNVVNAIKGDANHGENSPLYAALGYVPRLQRKSGLSRSKRTRRRTTPRWRNAPAFIPSLTAGSREAIRPLFVLRISGEDGKVSWLIPIPKSESAQRSRTGFQPSDKTWIGLEARPDWLEACPTPLQQLPFRSSAQPLGG